MNGYRIIVKYFYHSFGHGLENILNISRLCTNAKMNKGWLELESDPGEKFLQTTQLTNVSFHIKPDSLASLSSLTPQTEKAIKAWLNMNAYCVVKLVTKGEM